MPTFYFRQLSNQSEAIVQKVADQIQSYPENDSVKIGDISEVFDSQKIRNILTDCEVLIIVIAAETEPISNLLVSERIRWEIATAINLNLIIAALLIDDAELPEKSNLPGTLQHFLKCKPHRLRMETWFEDMENFMEGIQEELDFKRDVEEKLSQTNPQEFPIQDGLDKNSDASINLGLEFTGTFETQKTIDQEINHLEEARRKGNRNLEKKALSTLGLCFARLGQTQKAIKYFEEQLEIVRGQDDFKALCELLANLGDAYAVSGNYQQARSYYSEQLAIADMRSYLPHIGSSYNGLGFVHVKKNEILQAIKSYDKALEVYQELEDHDKTLELQVGIGLNYQKLGNTEKTLVYLEQALNTSRFIENRKEEARLLTDLAEINSQQGNNEKVKLYLGQVDKILNGINEAWTNSLKQRINYLKKLPGK